MAAPIRFASFFEPDARPGVEVDEADPQCIHAVAYDEAGKAVGTGRLLPDGQIGQVAVVKEWRRRGVGGALLDALIKEALRRGYADLTLTAPLQAAEFYRGYGFAPEGKITPLAGILVQKMRKPLARQ
ncbi:MAG TPA: GNAT family N-acetyltransferase [Burkholderiales bacterium]